MGRQSVAKLNRHFCHHDVFRINMPAPRVIVVDLASEQFARRNGCITGSLLQGEDIIDGFLIGDKNTVFFPLDIKSRQNSAFLVR